MKNVTISGYLPADEEELFRWITSMSYLGCSASVMIYEDGLYRATTSAFDTGDTEQEADQP